MRTGMQILVAAAVLGASTTAALAQGPYDDPSYWAKVERGQESALGGAVHALCAGLWLRAGLQPLLRPARGAILCAATDASMAVPVLLRPL